ncbi:MAG TPA: aminoglycoside phosphotransferase family protein [Actinopolymorphaceae bacterium]
MGGNRLRWSELPPALRREIESALGATVVAHESRDGGFSPGLASSLDLADGRRVFAKAISVARSPEGAGLHRQEIAKSGALPPSTPAPRLLWSYDDGEWVVLVFEDIPGRQPAEPWVPEELERVLDAMADLAAATTPSPIELEPAPTFHLAGWRTIAGDPALIDRLRTTDPWAVDHLAVLCALESRWPDAAAGKTLLHFDLRADNIVMTSDRVYFVDWPHARVGAAYIDLLAMLPSVAMHDIDPQPIVERHPVTRDVAPELIDVVLAAFAGYFVGAGMKPPVPLLPTLREFQLAQGRATLAWLGRRRRT